MQPDKHEITDSVEHERFLSLINSMTDAVVAINESHDIILYNSATLNLLDLNLDISNKPLENYLHLYDNNNNLIDFGLLIRDKQPPFILTDFLIHYNDGSKINLYLNISPVKPSFGQDDGRGYVIVMRDITREKTIEQEQDEFVSVVSHELRTPIAIAEGNLSNAQLLAKKIDTDSKIIQALDLAHDQILFLADMINDLTTLSRAERKTLKTDIEPIDCNQLLEGLYSDYSNEANKKGLVLKKQLNNQPLTVLNSQLYVHEILQNFITNSLKYTQAGEISISVTAVPSGVEFEVKDTGIGVSKPDQQKLFEKFFRSEDFRLKGTKGTGLGLYISKKLADLIHGTISLDSELSHGSSFKLFVPNLDHS